VLGDEYDPVTPPADGARTAASLGPAARFVELPGLGHGAVFSGATCPVELFQAFLDAPGRSPDTGCVASMGPPVWQVP
jgi:pimeloyl-ACP methyl ester carboxylesterase